MMAENKTKKLIERNKDKLHQFKNKSKTIKEKDKNEEEEYNAYRIIYLW